MTISEYIFEKLRQNGMTQKEFSKQTGIAESSISDWKRKKTNPSSESILIICKVLGVTPEELLSASDCKKSKEAECDYIVVAGDSSVGKLVEMYKSLDAASKERAQGYLEALTQVKKASLEDYIKASGNVLKVSEEIDWGEPVGGELW